MIAALFVHPGGVYYGLPDVDPWDEARDARKYPGPWKVIAHPPCKRWGRFSEGVWKGPPRFKTGDDEGCFKSALESVRKHGGVIEHPAGSKAWKYFSLPAVGPVGTWSEPDEFGGRSCSVWQSSYGHKCSKPTWLYGVGLDWLVPISKARKAGEYTITVNRWTEKKGKKHLPKSMHHLTPVEFRNLLMELVT